MWHFSYFENEKIQKRYLNIILNDYESNYETLLCNSDYTTMKIKNHTHVKKNFEKPEKSEFWKNKILEISSFYTCVLKATIIWGTVPEIQSETEFFVILDLFLHFYSPITTQKTKILKK